MVQMVGTNCLFIAHLEECWLLNVCISSSIGGPPVAKDDVVQTFPASSSLFLQKAQGRRSRVSNWPVIFPICKENFLDHISYAFRLEVTVGENVIAWMQRSDNERMEESWAAPASGAGLRALLPLSKVERCWLAPYAGSCSNSMM